MKCVRCKKWRRRARSRLGVRAIGDWIWERSTEGGRLKKEEGEWIEGRRDEGES